MKDNTNRFADLEA